MRRSPQKIDFSGDCLGISCPFQLAKVVSDLASRHLRSAGYRTLEPTVESALKAYRGARGLVIIADMEVDDVTVDRSMEMAIVSLLHSVARMLRDAG